MNHVITVRNRVITLPNTLNLISHSQALDTISFDVDAEWNGFRKIAVFKAGHDAPVEVAVDTNVTIPAEVLRKTGYIVIGLYGTKDEKIMPTLWSDRICVDIGTDTDGIGATPATAPLYEQALNKAEQAVATVQTFDSRITSAQNAASAAQSAVASKADATTVSALAQTVAGKADSTTVSALATTVSGKAESSAVSALATEVSEALAGKQDTISDLATIRSNASAVSGKQDAINDLDTIRSGAAAGATALQSVPIATSDNIGGAKFQTPNGLGINTTTGAAYVYPATDSNITSRNNNNRPITPSNMDTAFRTCITDPAQELTDEQKAAACATIGAERSRPWAKICEHTFETQTSDPYVIETYGQYKTFVYTLKCLNGNSGIYNHMRAVFDDDKHIACETSTFATGASYVYGMIDFENISIYRGIRETNAVNNMNLYSGTYTSQMTMFDELMRGGYITGIQLLGTKPAGMELTVFAR